ncbi:unnamed protein product [Protopolystoma xenopodis]|uniref:Uncharacterized protein n=1 Tax=Protopolystoma xenopodis TaxID=117903 RepID=A0A448X732_9PLAT|nr:unnamed protein product [Protopolystoma xenopodis]
MDYPYRGNQPTFYLPTEQLASQLIRNLWPSVIYFGHILKSTPCTRTSLAPPPPPPTLGRLSALKISATLPTPHVRSSYCDRFAWTGAENMP